MCFVVLHDQETFGFSRDLGAQGRHLPNDFAVSQPYLVDLGSPMNQGPNSDGPNSDAIYLFFCYSLVALMPCVVRYFLQSNNLSSPVIV